MASSDAQRRWAALPGGVANVEEAEDWDGAGRRAVDRARGVLVASARPHGRLLAAARLGAADRVLDIGCGTRESTRGAARAAVAGTALGVDLSSRMIARARERTRAEGPANVQFAQGDAQVYPFDGQAFDVALSRFGAMFFADPGAAFRNLARALRPGGRLALLAWQELGKNEWLSALREALAAGRTLPEPRPGEPGAFGLADAAAVRRLLPRPGSRRSASRTSASRSPWAPTPRTRSASCAPSAPPRGCSRASTRAPGGGRWRRCGRCSRRTRPPRASCSNSRAWLITARRP